jgi:hypothetical protein
LFVRFVEHLEAALEVARGQHESGLFVARVTLALQ